jgi:NADH-quinone oxidoreductase subunit C
MDTNEKDLSHFFEQLTLSLSQFDSTFVLSGREMTCEVAPAHLRKVLLMFRDEFQFESLMDIAAVDYSTYGLSEWKTLTSTENGFSRGVDRDAMTHLPDRSFRFGCFYLLLSLEHNLRVRLKVLLPQGQNKTEPEPRLDSVVDIYPSANWPEREAFDLFGILFVGHPDLRRILTDYGFIGHPFRKDFPLSGHVEMRYDEALGRVVYEPVTIEPRVLVPRVIREERGA